LDCSVDMLFIWSSTHKVYQKTCEKGSLSFNNICVRGLGRFRYTTVSVQGVDSFGT